MAGPEAWGMGAASHDRRVSANPRDHLAKDSILPMKLYCTNTACAESYDRNGERYVSLGSCFLIKELNADAKSDYLYFATAAHNLCCLSCKKYRWVKPILEWQEGQRKADKFLLGESDRGVSGEQGFYGWMKVAEQFKATTSDDKERYPFDYGILAVKIAGIDQAIEYAAGVRKTGMFAAPAALCAFVELAYLCGYPGKVGDKSVQGGRYWMPPRQSHRGKEAKGSDAAIRRQDERQTAALYALPQRHGETSSCPQQDEPMSKAQLYRHYIDSSPGQSGSPVYSQVKSNGDEQCVAMGIHVGLWKGIDAEWKSMGFNVAVRLDGEVLREMKGWVNDPSNKANGQSNPVPDADTLSNTENAPLDSETLTLFGCKAEPVPGAAAQAHSDVELRLKHPWAETAYKSFYPRLLDKMDPYTVGPQCFAKNLIIGSQKNPLARLQVSPPEHNQTLLEFVEKLDRDGFAKFREILRFSNNTTHALDACIKSLDTIGPDPMEKVWLELREEFSKVGS